MIADNEPERMTRLAQSFEYTASSSFSFSQTRAPLSAVLVTCPKHIESQLIMKAPHSMDDGLPTCSNIQARLCKEQSLNLPVSMFCLRHSIVLCFNVVLFYCIIVLCSEMVVGVRPTPSSAGALKKEERVMPA